MSSFIVGVSMGDPCKVVCPGPICDPCNEDGSSDDDEVHYTAEGRYRCGPYYVTENCISTVFPTTQWRYEWLWPSLKKTNFVKFLGQVWNAPWTSGTDYIVDTSLPAGVLGQWYVAGGAYTRAGGLYGLDRCIRGWATTVFTLGGWDTGTLPTPTTGADMVTEWRLRVTPLVTGDTYYVPLRGESNIDRTMAEWDTFLENIFIRSPYPKTYPGSGDVQFQLEGKLVSWTPISEPSSGPPAMFTQRYIQAQVRFGYTQLGTSPATLPPP